MEKEKPFYALPVTDDIVKHHRKLEEQISTLYKLSGYTLEDLIAKFMAGYTLCPPDNDYKLEELEEAIRRINSL